MDFTGISFKDLSWPAAAGLLFAFLLVKEARLWYTSWSDRRFRKRVETSENNSGKKEQDIVKAKQVEKIHETIAEALMMKDSVTQLVAMTKEIKERLERMDEKLEKHIDIINNHETRISVIEHAGH